MKDLIRSILRGGLLFIDTHLDKLILFFGFMTVLHWGIWLVQHRASDAISNEVFSFAHEFQGALLGLITGIAVGKRLASGGQQ